MALGVKSVTTVTGESKTRDGACEQDPAGFCHYHQSQTHGTAGTSSGVFASEREEAGDHRGGMHAAWRETTAGGRAWRRALGRAAAVPHRWWLAVAGADPVTSSRASSWGIVGPRDATEAMTVQREARGIRVPGRYAHDDCYHQDCYGEGYYYDHYGAEHRDAGKARFAGPSWEGRSNEYPLRIGAGAHLTRHPLRAMPSGR